MNNARERERYEKAKTRGTTRGTKQIRSGRVQKAIDVLKDRLHNFIISAEAFRENEAMWNYYQGRAAATQEAINEMEAIIHG